MSTYIDNFENATQNIERLSTAINWINCFFRGCNDFLELKVKNIPQQFKQKLFEMEEKLPQFYETMDVTCWIENVSHYLLLHFHLSSK